MPPPYPLAWPPTLSFVQPEVERVLREGVTAHASADVYLQHQALEFAQDEEGVSLSVLDLERDRGGGQRILRGRVLLGCDGANSFVRRAMGVMQDDLEFDECWMVVDARITRPVELPPHGIQYCWPSRPSTFVPGPGNLRRWEIKLLPGEDPKAFGSPDNVSRQIARFADPGCFEIWRSAVYRFHALLAREWRQGNVFLLGDACHQTPPFLGQGLCAGIRDAANLAWKLAMVFRDGASPALLDSYAAERKPHVRSTVATAKALSAGLGVPVYYYEDAATRPERRSLPEIRKGEYEALAEKLAKPEWAPDEGPAVFNARSGATVTGSRFPLVAFNVNLRTTDVSIADRIANLSPVAVQFAKAAVNRSFEMTLVEGVRYERQLFLSLFGTPDQKEGMGAFAEKRKPAFKLG